MLALNRLGIGDFSPGGLRSSGFGLEERYTSVIAMFRRQVIRIDMCPSGHFEIGHARWFSVALGVSEQFLSSFQVL